MNLFYTFFIQLYIISNSILSGMVLYFNEGLLIFCTKKDNIVWKGNLWEMEEDHFLKLLRVRSDKNQAN